VLAAFPPPLHSRAASSYLSWRAPEHQLLGACLPVQRPSMDHFTSGIPSPSGRSQHSHCEMNESRLTPLQGPGHTAGGHSCPH
jgi:hypothetical protein